jgi:hypothetical protein
LADVNVKFKVFGRQSCEVCHKVNEKMEYFRSHWLNEAKIDYFDIETMDGMAEGAFNDVADIPTVVLEKDGKEQNRWTKTAPTFEELKTILSIPVDKPAR